MISRAQDLTWHPEDISDAWFDAHFNFSADVVAEWVGKEHLARSHVLDFGCGDGITALGLILRHGATRITGIDISETHRGLRKLAQQQIGLPRLPKSLYFEKIKPGAPFKLGSKSETIISWSTFEHIELHYLNGILRNIYDQLTDDGLFFLQINPLYFSPYGSHLSRFSLEPWAHLLCSPEEVEEAVMRFRGEIPADELEENFHKRDFVAYKKFVLREYHQLNRLTSSQLVQKLAQNGFVIEREAYGKVDVSPPASLLVNYSCHDLVTDEIRLLCRKKLT